jgi:hypothetical protein
VLCSLGNRRPERRWRDTQPVEDLRHASLAHRVGTRVGRKREQQRQGRVEHAAVDAAYVPSGGPKTYASDAERVAFLFELYQHITSLLPAPKPKICCLLNGLDRGSR